MRKEELRHDAFRENIIKGVEYFNENRSTVIKIFAVLILIISGISYYKHLGSAKIESAGQLAGRAQNTFINGNLEEALVKFERVLNDYPKTPGATQSLVYLLGDAIKNNNIEEINKLLSENNGFINDSVVLSAILELRGNVSLKNGNYSDALKYFKKAHSNTSVNVIKYELNLATVYIAQGNYNDALNILENIIDNAEVRFNENNIAEELLSFVKQKMSI